VLFVSFVVKCLSVISVVKFFGVKTMANAKLIEWLEAGEEVLGDGAMGTMLQAAGLTDGGAPELWNVTQPDKVRAVHQGYVDAGSRIVETNTFGGNQARLQFHNIGDRVHELNVAGARLARQAAGTKGALVAGSVGPTGDLIEPVGTLTMADAEAMFAEQVRGLVDGGVDFILIETMSHLNEVEAAIRGARRVDPNLTIAVTLSFDTNFHTMMGVSPQQAVEQLSALGIRVIGANCGNGPAEIEVVMAQMAQHRPAGVFLMAQSNAGLPSYAEGKVRYDGTPEVMAEYALKMRRMGINVIGACCGSTPAHIAAMGEALEGAHDELATGDSVLASDAVIESADSRATRSAERRQARRQRLS
jgi:5-methyltetrahydrofolate--homocysteine methyltransferase